MKKIFTLIFATLICFAANAQVSVPAITFSVEEGAEIDNTETEKIHVSVALPEGMDAKDELYIEGVLSGNDGTNIPIISYGYFEDGCDVNISSLSLDYAFAINITKISFGQIIDFDPDTYMPIYETSIEAEEGESLATLNFSVIEPSGIDNVSAAGAKNVSKVINNGRLVIVKGGKQFNAAGALLK